jgi:hypothetical protein
MRRTSSKRPSAIEEHEPAHRHACEPQRRGAERRGKGMGIAALREHVPDQLAQHDAERHGGDQDHERGRVGERPDHEFLDHHTEPADRGDCDQTGEQQHQRAVQPRGAREQRLEHGQRHERRDQRDVAVREVNDVEDAEQQAEADRQERVDARQDQPVHHLLDDRLFHASLRRAAGASGT